MIRKGWKRALAMVLSTAMVMTGISFPTVTANADTVDKVIWSDDMDEMTTEEAGWTIAWSGTTGTESRAANAWAANNKTAWWSFKTETEAETLTLTRTVTGMKAGAYKASVDVGGGKATGTIAVSAAEDLAAKTEDVDTQTNDITLGGWDGFVTTTTDVLNITETSNVTIEIKFDSQVEGWFDLDNIQLIREVDENEKVGSLVNGALNINTDGWTFAGDVPATTDSTAAEGYMMSSDTAGGYLSIWSSDGFAGEFSMSQTIENMEAGSYTAKIAAVGDGSKGASQSKNSLSITATNVTQDTEVSAQIVPDGWDNWDAVTEAEALEVKEGDNVTITISGTLDGKEWYGLKNVEFDAAKAVEAPINVEKVPGLSEDFIHGIDVSSYMSQIQSGVKYYDENGVEKNMFEIFRDGGANYVRLRVWNCPFSVDESGNYLYVDEAGKEYTADQVTTDKDANGFNVYTLADGTEVYRKGYGAGNCDIETAIAIGKIATQYGMRVLIDFHYSDFWADPAKLRSPKAWEDMDITAKAAALGEYTTDCLTQLKEAGVDVGMVQVGNEINGGMAGEKDWSNVTQLLTAGCKAVRDFDKNILIAIHYADPHKEGFSVGKAKALAEANIDYDVFASSYYPFWHGTIENLTSVLSEIATTYGKKVMVAEVSYIFTEEDGDGWRDIVPHRDSSVPMNYSVDAEGQAAAVRDAIAAVSAVGEAGIGTFYWEPAWIPVENYAAAETEEEKAEILASNSKMWQKYGSGWASQWSGPLGDDYDPDIDADPLTHGSEWDNQAMFDFNGVALPSINVYKWVYTGAEGPIRVSTVDTCTYTMDYKQTPELPAAVNVNLNDGNIVENVAVNWNTEQLAALATADFGDYIIDGELAEFSYESKGETIIVKAGDCVTTCAVTVVGTNYLTNGDFEEQDDAGCAGWTLSAGTATCKSNASDAKSGAYHWTAYGTEVDFTVEQTITDKLPNGKYTLLAYYQGTKVDSVDEAAGLYAEVTYADGTTSTHRAEIQIPNAWLSFYMARVSGIVINENVTNVVIKNRLACVGTGGAWVVFDDARLMKGDEL
ncbi:MAG: glycosyl hydrolase 53 family protein, partial [Lachnospiraceae bacterium]|nr:glycosyl hydrolase 53 family protein [Lachnospiraceae bacterium]